MSKIDELVPEDLGTNREKEIGQHIGYRYDVNLVPDYDRITPFLKKYLEIMDWKDLNWLEDVHLGYEEDRAAVFDRNSNGWVTVPEEMELPDNQQDRDMIARELLIKFQMSKRHPMVVLRDNYGKFQTIQKIDLNFQTASHSINPDAAYLPDQNLLKF